MRVFILCMLVVCIDAVIIRRIDKVSPNQGTTLGGTRITITGVGFSSDYAHGQNHVLIDGNMCTTIEKQGVGVCMGKCSTSEKIVCDTPPHEASGWLKVQVTVDSKYPIANSGQFQYINGFAGATTMIYPAAGKAGSILNLLGSDWPEFLKPFYKNVQINPQEYMPPTATTHGQSSASEKGEGAVCRIDPSLNYWRMRYVPRDLLGPEHPGGTGLVGQNPASC